MEPKLKMTHLFMLIAQISDLHIVEKDRDWLLQPSTDIKNRVLKTIAHLNELSPRPDVVILSGDATDDGSPLAYLHLKELIANLQIPLLVVPGNHDRRESMREALAHHAYIPAQGFIQYVIDDYPVRLVGLDTLVEGKTHGNLSESQVSWLADVLRSNPEKPTLIFMHHPPVKIGMRLFDQMYCHAPASFEKLIRESENVIGIVTGHYHHLCVSSFGGKLCFLAPSVAPVHHFAHPDHEYVSAIELEDPGITLHRWQGGNSIASHVVRLKETRERIDWALIKPKGH